MTCTHRIALAVAFALCPTSALADDPPTDGSAPEAPEAPAAEAPAAEAPAAEAPAAEAPASAPEAPEAPAAAPEAPAAASEASEASAPPAPEAAPTGELYVTSTPAGGRILVDGEDTGKITPVMLQLPAGDRQILVTQGCERGAAQVAVRVGLIARADVPLATGPGSLLVETTPPGAVVLLDDVQVGETPLELADVACGAHTLLIRADGYAPIRRSLDVQALGHVDISETLVEATFGTLVVAPTPLEARVVLDGEERGFGPMTLDDVLTGPHELRVSADGWRDHFGEIIVTEGEVTRIDVALEQARSNSVLIRGGVSAGLGLVGLGFTAAALHNLSNGRAAYQDVKSVQDPATGQALYEGEVVPRYRLARIEGIAGLVAFVGAGAVWAIPGGQASTPTVPVLRGTW